MPGARSTTLEKQAQGSLAHLPMPDFLASAQEIAIAGFGKTGAAVLEYLIAIKTPARITVFTGKSEAPASAQASFAREKVRFIKGLSSADLTGALKDFSGDQAKGTLPVAHLLGGTLPVGTQAADDKALGSQLAQASKTEVAKKQSEASRPCYFDLAVVSPGFKPGSELIQFLQKNSDRLIGEIEFAWENSPKNWFCISGTNGKTTATSLLAQLINDACCPCETVGNIGVAATSRILGRDPKSFFAAELSSFQLETTQDFHPRAAALLNITPDHLSWHGSFENYARAKEKLFAQLDSSDLAVISVDDEPCRRIASHLHARGLRVLELSSQIVPSTQDAAYLDKDKLMLRLDGQEICLARVSELRLKGAHNMQNILAAAALALFAGAELEPLKKSLKRFEALEHRLEYCGNFSHIDFINDSKATNVDATLAALEAFSDKRPVLLLGGHDKLSPLNELAERVGKTCSAVVCYGEAAARFYAALSKAEGIVAQDTMAKTTKVKTAKAELSSTEAEGIKTGDAGASDAQARDAKTESTSCLVMRAPHLKEALNSGFDLAKTHGAQAVLLSPACSSFDEFSCFEERGKYFKQEVSNLLANAQASSKASEASESCAPSNPSKTPSQETPSHVNVPSKLDSPSRLAGSH